MSTSSMPRVTDAQGVTGRLDLDASGAEEAVRVRLEDGSTARVPRHLLSEQGDGTYRLDGSFERFAAGGAAQTVEEEVVPLVEEEVSIRKEERETGRVRIKKRVREHVETVDEPLVREEVEVERVPVNTVIAKPATIREQGDTTIIPVMEERLVVTKEIVLVEELHVKRKRTEHREPQRVTLRREEAEVERIDLRRRGEAERPGPHNASADDERGTL